MFEVINQEGICVMYTNHAECIYSYDILKQMQSSGHKFRLNGKRAAPETLAKITADKIIYQERDAVNRRKGKQCKNQ